MPVAAMAEPMGLDQASVHPTYLCDRWARNEQCLYCDIGNFQQVKKEKHDKGIITAVTPDQLASVVALAQKESGVRHFNVCGGSILGTRNGKSEVEWYCDYLYAINEKINGNWMSSWISIGVKEKEDIKRLYDTGVPALSINTEVWGEHLHKIICPSKSAHTEWEQELKQLIDAVDIFGKGRILSNFVSGVEMSQPWGFKDALSAVKHTSEGFEFLMAHGVLPRMCMWIIEQGSRLAGQQPPPFEYYIEIERSYLELRQKYNFPLPFYGHCRGCYMHDTLADWDYYFWRK